MTVKIVRTYTVRPQPRNGLEILLLVIGGKINLPTAESYLARIRKPYSTRAA